MSDPRHYQIAVLLGLLAYGMAALDFEVEPLQAAATLTAVLLIQAALDAWMGQPFEWRSALISGLSLFLLCRTREVGWCLAAALVAIGGKFFLRYQGRHLFNPTNLALMVLLLISEDQVWVSPGQWGNAALLALLLACLAGLVLSRAGRWDIALGFLAFWTLLLVGRSWWLHEPMTIPLHRLQNGALLLFAFFMISDPKTTPDSRVGRLVFAGLVALGGWWWQFLQYGTHGSIWALAVLAPMVPLLNVLFPGPAYRWPARPPSQRLISS